jgi:ribulose-phosphate 3-epimerase
MKVRIAPSILAADFARLGDALAVAEEGGADLVHVDVMDGRFVPNITFGAGMVQALRRATRLALDVHLMIDRPEETLSRYLDSGADMVSIHVESTAHLSRCLSMARERGVRAGGAINPATPAILLEPTLDQMDHVLVMSVNPGWGGQSFLPGSLEKIRAVAALSRSRGRSLPVEIDGGVDCGNAALCVAAGAEILVAGTSVYGNPDPVRAIGELRTAAGTGVVA